MRPLFEDNRSRVISFFQAGDESTDPGIVASGRTGEERQMRIAIAPVLMQVKVDQRQVRIEAIIKLQVVVARGGAKVGVAQVETHADMSGWERIQRATFGEQFLE